MGGIYMNVRSMTVRSASLFCIGPLILTCVAQTPVKQPAAAQTSAVQPSGEPGQPKPSDAAQRLFDEANKLAGGGDYEGASKALDRALALARETHDAVGEVRAHRERALFLEAVNRVGEAVEEWREAAAGWERLEDGPGRIEALGRAGSLLLARNPGDAKALLEQALSLSGEEKRRPGAAGDAMHSVGRVMYRRGNLEWATRVFQKVLEIAGRLEPNSLAVAASLNDLGTVALDQGDLTAAKAYHQQALAIKEKLAPGSLDVAAR